MNQDPHNNQPSFFERQRNIRIMLGVFYLICIALAVADFVVHRHVYTSLEASPGFYAAYGFIACVLLVLIAKLLRKVLMRSDNYYGDIKDKEDS